MEEEKTRLFVGGVSSEVSAGDLQERFAPLGNVKSITLPSAKTGVGHRGFAYVDFVPSTDASLRKLFSAYNGCKWRGGLLRIEKAKEHFSDRLHREWAVEEAALTKDPPPNEVEVVQQSAPASVQQKQVKWDNKGDMEVSGLKIFFPNLKKLRTVPLNGLGKHKRSFQRVETSPLQLLLTCACEESLRPGSCDCSKINDVPGVSSGMSSLKGDTCRENDDIVQAIEIERQRQLELLNRLFPSDSTSISLENQQVVELDSSEGKDEGAIGSVEKTSSEQTLLPTVTESVKREQPTDSLQRSEFESVAGKGHSDPLDSKLDLGNGGTGFEDDSTSTAMAREREKQLELMHRLFPVDAPSTREPEMVVHPEASKVRKKRKLNGSTSCADLVEPAMDGLKGTSSDHFVHLRSNLAETNCGQLSSEPQKSPMQRKQVVNVSKTIPALKSNDSAEGLSETILSPGDDSVPEAIAEDQEMQAATLSEDDSEMVLNVGDDSFSLATAEEQEKQEVKSLSARANELVEKVSEITRHLNDNSLSFSKAEVRERQTSKSSQKVILEDGLEDSEMTLNLGNDFLPPSIAEQQEKALVRSFSLAKDYNWTRTSSDSEDLDNIEESGSEEDHSDYSRDADEAHDNDSEEHSSGEQGESDSSSDAEEGDEAEDSETEEHSSEEQDDSLDNNDHSELILPIRRTNSKLAEASLRTREGESSVGKQLDESSKWAALADMCHFRTESTMQSEESKLERNSEASSNKGEDMPFVQVSDFQADESKTPSQQQTDADGGKPDNLGQKLTRAAWKSLVGETGRVVFSLRQLTGSILPQTPPLTQETQTIKDTHTQVEPSVSSKTSNQKEAKSKQATTAAEKKHLGVRSFTDPKLKAAGLINAPVNLLVSSSNVCPFMKSENAEKEWLATKSDLRSDYRAKQKHAARNVKKLWGKR